jgi:hypothetical protein
MFSKQWFNSHQAILLRFANTWLGKKILRIDSKEKLIGILPNAIFWKGKKKNEYVAEFRTHDKFGKRLYYAFKPLWYLFHLWDMVWYPKFNLGFDSLTVYPDASPESTSVDGYARRQSAGTWSQLRDGAGITAGDADGNLYVNLASGNVGDQWNDMVRSAMLFDTSSISSGSTISAATLSIYGSSKTDQFSQSIGITSVSLASNTAVVASDYAVANWGSTRFATDITVTSWSNSAYNDFALNASGLAAVIAGGISKFGMRSSGDIDNTAPTWADSLTCQVVTISADAVGTTTDPKLVVTYTLPSSGTSNFAYFM